jgi:hypothetical protein
MIFEGMERWLSDLRHPLHQKCARTIIWRNVSELFGVLQELSGVSEAARELAMSRFRLIQPHLEKNRPLQLVATDGKIPFRTAQRRERHIILKHCAN